MLTMNELKPKTVFIMDGDPYVVLDVQHIHMGRGGSSIQTKLKNLKTGILISRNFKQSDVFEEAEMEKTQVEYLYSHRNEYWFCDFGDRSKRFSLPEKILEEVRYYLKSGIPIEAWKLKDEILSVELPIKMDFKVVEAPPNIRGNTSQGGTKIVTLETGAKVSVPLFVEEGDLIKINTQSGEYVERVQKN